MRSGCSVIKKIPRNGHLKLNCVCYSHGNILMRGIRSYHKNTPKGKGGTSPHGQLRTMFPSSGLALGRRLFSWKKS